MAENQKKGPLLNLNHNLFVLKISRILEWKYTNASTMVTTKAMPIAYGHISFITYTHTHTQNMRQDKKKIRKKKK